MKHPPTHYLRWGGLAAVLVSGALLGGAHAFEHWGGLAPCELCLRQRWPHWIVLGLGLAVLLAVGAGQRGWARAGLAAASAAMLVSVGLGIQHVGVEQRWWQGPGTCSGSVAGGGSPAEIMSRLLVAPVVRCDDIAWQLFGISMAGYNALFSLALAGFLAWALVRSRTP